MSQARPASALGLTTADVERLAAYGIPLSEAERQLRLLRHPPPKRRLVRPCTRGDGIRTIDDPAERERLGERFDEAVAAGRLSRMVPASGAASRMFAALSGLLAEAGAPPDLAALRASAQGGDDSAAAISELYDRRRELPFWEELSAAAGPGGEDDLQALVGALLAPAPDGLGYARRPKGLIPFHRYPEGVRTPFEEHLAEAAAHHGGRDAQGGVQCPVRCRVHFTVGTAHEASFRELLARRRRGLEERFGVALEVTFSQQSPATDTLAVDPDGRPFRGADGSLLLRPGGHGALLANLDHLVAAGADLVQIKNIDNVVPERNRALVTSWQRVLGGLLVELRATANRHLERLEAGADPDTLRDAEGFVEAELGLSAPNPDAQPAFRRQALIHRLDRPWRVCGMVANQGEPGGGPFWVRHAGGPITPESAVTAQTVTPQIVEGAEIDLADPAQSSLRDAATHFNPVDLVCALRDRHDRPYPLADLTDPDAVFLAAKTHHGRPLRYLERPGLWNGSMARWNTVFVEVPAATFAPVKTVLDLLRPAHRREREALS